MLGQPLITRALPVGGYLYLAAATAYALRVRYGRSWSEVLVGEALLAVGFLAVAATCCLGFILHTQRRNRALRRQRPWWQPRLHQWYDLRPDQQVSDYRLEDWLRSQRDGMTIAEADHWSAHGYPPGLADAARRHAVPLATVDDLRQVMRDTGVWDGLDRAKLEDLIGWHIELTNGVRYPVLHRWAAHPTETVRRAVLTTLADGFPAECALDELESTQPASR